MADDLFPGLTGDPYQSPPNGDLQHEAVGTPSSFSAPQAPSAVDSIIGSTQPEPTGVKSSGAVGASSKGLTDAGIAKTRQLGGFAGVDQRTDRMMAGRQGEINDAAQHYQSATQQIFGAIHDASAAEREHWNRVLSLHDRISDFNETQAHVEEKARLQSKAESDGYVAQIKEQLAGVRGLMAANPNPMAHMTGVQGFSLGMAQAAQAFLGARGVHVDVAGQVDKWVDREIQQHQMAIQNARGAVSDTVSLYGIARQTSADDFEARQRMRAFVIEGFKNRLLVEGDRFNSDIAKARAQEQIGRLDIEMTNTLDGLRSRFYNERLATRNAMVDEVSKQGHLAIAQEQLKIQQMDEMRKMLADAAKNKAEMGARVLYDTTASGGGQARWVLNNGIKNDDKRVMEYQDAQSSFAALQSDVSKFREMLRQGNMGGLAGTRFQNTHDAQMRSLHAAILSKYAQAISGKVITDNEMKRFEETIPAGKWGSVADLDAVMAQTENSWRSGLDQKRYQIAHPIDANDPNERAFVGSRLKMDHFGEGEQIDAAGAAAGESRATSVVKAGIGQITGDGSNRKASADDAEKIGVDLKAVQRMWEAHGAQAPRAQTGGEKANAALLDIAGKSGNLDPATMDAVQSAWNSINGTAEKQSKEAPEYATGIVGLAEYAKIGDRRALNVLLEIATGTPTSGESGQVPQEGETGAAKQSFARYVLNEMGMGKALEAALEQHGRAEQQNAPLLNQQREAGYNALGGFVPGGPSSAQVQYDPEIANREQNAANQRARGK